MSSATLSSSPFASSTIDEQLRLRITEELAGSFKGEIIGPDHADYERARLVWNAMVDRRPGLILRCTSTQDVVAAVNAAGRPGEIRPGPQPGGSRVVAAQVRELVSQPVGQH